MVEIIFFIGNLYAACKVQGNFPVCEGSHKISEKACCTCRANTSAEALSVWAAEAACCIFSHTDSLMMPPLFFLVRRSLATAPAYLLCGMLLLFCGRLQAGCTEEALSQALLKQKALCVVKGNFFLKETLWANGHLHTLHHLSVSTCEKGCAGDTLLVLTPGGSTDTLRELAYPRVDLPLGVPMQLFLEPQPRMQGVFRCVGGAAGAQVLTVTEVAGKAAGPVIANLVPDVLVAGRNEKLTIFGSGFGNSSAGGKVLFRDANKGGNSFTEVPGSDFISWSDTKIELYLPDFAGTGPAQVSKNGATAIGGSMQVLWARSNYSDGNQSYETRLYDKNATGGYFFTCKGTLAADTAAVNRIREAIRSWRCATLANISYNASEQAQTETVEFAAPGELATGILGICYSTFTSCNGKDWSVSKLHVMFRDSVAWNTGTEAPGANRYDFFSVALHELGHALQLGHVIDPNDVMHYAIGKDVMRREPGTNNIAGVTYNREQSAAGLCSLKGFRALATGMCSNEELSFFSFSNARLFPNPTRDVLYLELFSDREGEGTLGIYDSRGRRVAFRSVDLQPGLNEYQLDSGTGLGVGVYYLWVEAGGNLLKKKFVVLR